jgi:hypothetical protein
MEDARWLKVKDPPQKHLKKRKGNVKYYRVETTRME